LPEPVRHLPGDHLRTIGSFGIEIDPPAATQRVDPKVNADMSKVA